MSLKGEIEKVKSLTHNKIEQRNHLHSQQLLRLMASSFASRSGISDVYANEHSVLLLEPLHVGFVELQI